jgi:histone H3/H4
VVTVLRRSGVRRIAEREKTKPDYQMSEEAVMALGRVAELFTGAVSREAWRVLGASNSPLHNNGSRVRLQPRDVESAALYLLTNPEALTKLVEALGLKP